jgi:hypothetical protein
MGELSVFQQILIGAAGDGTGGLAATFVMALVNTVKRQVRERFATPERTQALQRAFATAFKAAVADWTINAQDVTHYSDLFEEWLLTPEVLREFHALLTPDERGEINAELLRTKFESSGFNADYLGIASFDVFLKDFVGSFYQAVAEEPVLQEAIKIDLLRQMTHHIGALDRLWQQQMITGEQAVDHLAQIQRLVEGQVQGQDNTNELLQQILDVLIHVEQHGSDNEQIEVYQQSELALARVGLVPEALTPPDTNGESAHTLSMLQQIRTILSQIHTRLTAGDNNPSPIMLAALEVRYRQTLIDQFATLTFEGLQPSGVPIRLPLEKIYVELKAVADVPEAADTYSAEERRLLLEAEDRGMHAREELAIHLDALRAERWNRQARQQMGRLQRRSIQELLDSPTHRGLVILGDPGSGKTTLLRYQAL